MAGKIGRGRLNAPLSVKRMVETRLGIGIKTITSPAEMVSNWMECTNVEGARTVQSDPIGRM